MFRTQSGSSSRSRPALAGSGALSHVYVQNPPLRCNIPGVLGLHYDDGNKLLLASTSNQIFPWQANQFTSEGIPNAVTIKEGPVLSIRYSLDGKIIGVQRSQQEVEFINRETSKVFNLQCKVESECILGFFWTDCPTCDIVLVKTSGLDLYSLQVQLNSLKFVETKRFNVSWYAYTHESRLVLLASGMQCKILTGFQFSAGGIIRLPKFEAAITKAEVNKKPVLGPEDVQIATMYGRIYCLQVDRVGMQLHLYRFYRDAVVYQGSLPIYSTKVAINVVDNVLLVHQVDAKVVLLYDIFADSKAPISAPLPLLVRGPSGSTVISARNKDKQSGSSSSQSAQAETLTASEGNVYGDGWVFLNPDLICDNIHGILWRVHLDLEAIAASSSEVPSLLAFLQRRRLEADKAKQLSLAVMRSIILERRALSVIVNAMDILTASYSQAMKLANYLAGAPETAGSNRAVSQQPSDSHLNGQKTFKLDASPSKNAGVADMHGKATKAATDGTEVEKETVHAVITSALRESSSSSFGDTDSQENVNSGHVSARPEGSSSTQNVLPSDVSKDDSREDTTVKVERRASIDSENASARHEKALVQSESSEIHAQGPLESAIPERHRPQTASTIISPDEIYNSVFAVVEEEISGDPMYLVTLIVEYFRSAAAEKLKVPPGLHVLTVQLLARDECYVELEQFVLNKIVEPSKEVAMELLEIGSSHIPTRKLGIDMLRQLSCHSEYVSLLLQDGRFIEALRYVRRNRVLTIPPVLFLEAAVSTKESQKLASVLRFCTDFVPNFDQTLDYSTFFTILNDTNNTIVT